MKKNVFILLILLLVINISCKNNTEAPVKEAVKIEEVVAPNNLTITFVFKTNKADVFRVKMNNIEVDELQKKNIEFFENVIPSASFDEITANFDADNISNSISLNLGNKEVKEVEIKSITVSYGEKVIEITNAKDLDKYLSFNKFIEKDSALTTIKTKKVNGQHYPEISLKRNLLKLLTK